MDTNTMKKYSFLLRALSFSSDVYIYDVCLVVIWCEVGICESQEVGTTFSFYAVSPPNTNPTATKRSKPENK